MLFADKASNSCTLEDDLQEMAEIRPVPRRKSNLTQAAFTKFRCYLKEETALKLFLAAF
ncbi:hypothetical protein [Criblamydia sequanensis]|uniref:hypothetical protein n=1 Tax=Candidatus Criblamydia sequanensis TaxID=340071 RepID=UPI0012ABE8D3|nr:hypothetical protein [Criblamydia sequanensis]